MQNDYKKESFADAFLGGACRPQSLPHGAPFSALKDHLDSQPVPSQSDSFAQALGNSARGFASGGITFIGR